MTKAAAAALLLLVAATAAAQFQPCNAPSGRSVTVNGDATVALPPDRASFTVGVETESTNPAEAFRRNSEKLNALVAALKARGVAPQEIQTSQFSITSRDGDGKKLREGYRVTNLVTVTREDLASIGNLLQLAVEKGANEAGSLQFSSSARRSAELRGLELAYQNAHAKAEKLAALAGKQLGDALCVSESGYTPVMGFVAEAITVTAQAPAIETGVERLNFRVGAVFELK